MESRVLTNVEAYWWAKEHPGNDTYTHTCDRCDWYAVMFENWKEGRKQRSRHLCGFCRFFYPDYGRTR